MPAYVEEQGIGYPVAIDIEEKTVSAYAVDSYPDYYLIDRAGKLRFADLANKELDSAVEMLLAEPAPADLESGAESRVEEEADEGAAVDAAQVLKSALVEARASKRRVLVHLGAPW